MGRSGEFLTIPSTQIIEYPYKVLVYNVFSQGGAWSPMFRQIVVKDFKPASSTQL